MSTATGFICLTVVLDAFSRRIVGWSMANHLRAELVLQALDMAVGRRRPESVIHHSDQGSQRLCCRWFTLLAPWRATGCRCVRWR